MAPRSSGSLRILPTIGLFVVAASCGGRVSDGSTSGVDVAGLPVPKQVRVDGVTLNVESNYLPRVVQCENAGTSFEAMKAQAVASRTYLTYRTAGSAVPTIRDGQSDQVYTCAANGYGKSVSDAAVQAVQQTSGQVVLWNGAVTAGFFVAGASRDAANSCKKLADATSTERYVTYNDGLVDTIAHPTSLGSKTNLANRGALGQRMADCLAQDEGYDYAALLRYFYGSDTQVALPGATPLDPDAVAAQQQSDVALATCWSARLSRPIPLDACAIAVDGSSQQCLADGTWAPATLDGSGDGEGPDGACESLYGG